MTNDLKKVAVSAVQRLNKQLCLPRTKKVQYDEEQYFSLLTFLALEGCAAEDGSSVLNDVMSVPSGEALLRQLKKFDCLAVEQEFDELFVKQFYKVAKKRKPRVTAIIDVHEQETYTKVKRTSKDVRGGKHKNGTNFFFQFVTIQILFEQPVLTMGVRLYSRDRTLRSIVDELVRHVQQYACINLLLLDRGFRDVELFNQLEYLQVPLIMPAFSDEKTKRQLAKKRRTPRWSLKNKQGEHADLTLLRVMLPDEKIVGFYTTMRGTWMRTARFFLDLYKRRWTIETGYRVQNQFLATTTCIVGAVRLYYFSYAVALHNLWLDLRNTLLTVRFTVLRLKMLLSSTLPVISIEAPT